MIHTLLLQSNLKEQSLLTASWMITENTTFSQTSIHSLKTQYLALSSNTPPILYQSVRRSGHDKHWPSLYQADHSVWPRNGRLKKYIISICRFSLLFLFFTSHSSPFSVANRAGNERPRRSAVPNLGLSSVTLAGLTSFPKGLQLGSSLLLPLMKYSWPDKQAGGVTQS